MNILVRYTVFMFFSVVITATLFSFILQKITTKSVIESHVTLFPQIVELHFEHYLEEIVQIIETPALTTAEYKEKIKHSVQEIMERFTSHNIITHINIWDMNHSLILEIGDRSKPEIIPAKYLQQAVEKNTAFKLGKNNVLILYVPLIFNSNTYGVFELFLSNEKLFLTLNQSILYIRSSAVAAGTILYSALFFIFFDAHRRQQSIGKELESTRDVIIFALGHQAELRDFETGKHLERTAEYVRLLAEGLSQYEEYRRYLTETYINDLVKTAPLHDIGKVGVPDAILLKPGKLNKIEYEMIKSHSNLGYDILSKSQERLGKQAFLEIAMQITKYHHEKWDGTGYPDGLSGKNIPLSARIMAVADVYDALRTERHYKQAFSHNKCMEILQANAGKHFDPDIIDVFRQKQTEFEKISNSIV